MDVKMAILQRRNLRALVKCKQCNHFNGNRALSCKNKLCPLSRMAVQRRPKLKIDAVQLINHGDSKLFSVKVRDDVRNFVSITDKVISSDDSGALISRNAICYIDTCKYDSSDVNISCKHIKCSLEPSTLQATPLTIQFDVLNTLKTTSQSKSALWSLYSEGETSIPIVQRINGTMFTVKCDVSKTFPAGLLHVVFGNGDVPSQMCACKKLKILMSPINGSIVLENDKCDHLLLVFAAIMSDVKLKDEFLAHTSMIEECFDGIRSNEIRSQQSMTSSIDSVIDFENLTTTIATDFSADGVPMPTTLIDNLENIELIQIPNAMDDDRAIIDFENNVRLEKFADDSNETHSMNLDSIQIIDETATNDVNLESLELIDCQVELMDQFTLTECMEFFDGNKIYSGDNQIDYFDACPIRDMTLAEWNNVNGEYSDFYQKEAIVDDNNSATVTTAPTTIPASNSPRKIKKATKRIHPIDVTTTVIDAQQDDVDAQLNFNNWLDSVIEMINLTIDFTDDGYPEPLVFSVSQQFFAILRTKFSAGTTKKRLPNRTVLLNEGKYRGLTLFAWNFANLQLIQHIFSTKNMSLEVIRTFHKISPGVYKYVDINDTLDIPVTTTSGSKTLRKIRPTEYKTFLKTKCTQDLQRIPQLNKCGLFVVEWIPNVLPKSGYGEMRIRLQFGHMKNNQILKRT